MLLRNSRELLSVYLVYDHSNEIFCLIESREESASNISSETRAQMSELDWDFTWWEELCIERMNFIIQKGKEEGKGAINIKSKRKVECIIFLNWRAEPFKIWNSTRPIDIIIINLYSADLNMNMFLYFNFSVTKTSWAFWAYLLHNCQKSWGTIRLYCQAQGPLSRPG